MFATFNSRKDTHKINSTPVEVKEIVGDTATVELPTGRKAHLPVKELVSLSGEISFNAEGGAEVVEYGSEAETEPEGEELPE